jgi:hypothetical protein
MSMLAVCCTPFALVRYQPSIGEPEDTEALARDSERRFVLIGTVKEVTIVVMLHNH